MSPGYLTCLPVKCFHLSMWCPWTRFIHLFLLRVNDKINIYNYNKMFQHFELWFRSRSFLCGIATANQYILASISTKTYYNIETFLTLPGAILFYGCISLFGYLKLEIHTFWILLLFLFVLMTWTILGYLWCIESCPRLSNVHLKTLKCIIRTIAKASLTFISVQMQKLQNRHQ